ncbi:cytochrome c maturation protein CcmE [Candidatus Poribacteria bacterium]|nr:cytochrome c maturation protein CcmE [Candidatus Poribacteria bacterium]
MRRSPIKFVLAGALLTIGAAAFGVATFTKQGASLTHFTPDQLVSAEKHVLSKRGIQVDGFVAEGTEQFDPAGPELRFKVRDEGKTAFVNVIYREGLKPDSFQEGQGVVVEGTYDPGTNTIQASKLMTKCPSKYEATSDAQTSASAAQDRSKAEVAGSAR